MSCRAAACSEHAALTVKRDAADADVAAADINDMDVVISVDTAVAHIAAAMDCPCVVLFGYHGWGRWVPRAPRSQVIPLGNRETKDDGNVASISAADALAAWQRLLPRGG